MKVILIEDIPKLGVVGDVADVSDGYARNYLIPKNFALPVTKGTMKQIENIKAQKATKAEKERKQYSELATKLEGVSIDIPVETGDEDKIFGTVTSPMIAEALLEKGFEIDKRIIQIDTQINTLGVYNVTIDLHPEIKPKIRVWVVSK